MLGFLGKIRKILGKLTDWLLIGREQGWWDKLSEEQKREYLEQKHRPTDLH